MPPKKEKSKNNGEEKTTGFNEVEKTFLELQIADCNRKIARLRTVLEEYEVRNEELQTAYDKLDEDRADIIAYLKKTLNIKTEEYIEMKEKVRGLEEIRDIENAQFHETVTELERNFSIMKDQLTSENKLLAGKLNTLEEFRAIRDDLMKKYEKQEKDFEEQEMKYKRIIYDAEKKFVIGKDKLKKEMEARLLQLAQDFQDATELRVAASTHRVIRENIAISNELDGILLNQQKVSTQNETLKDSIKAAIIAKELAEEERDKAINKNVVQLKIIDQLTAAFEDVKKQKCLFEKKSYDFDVLEEKIQNLTKENEDLGLKVRILEQNLHSKLSDQNKSVAESSKVSKERNKLRKILKEAAYAIQAALKLDQWATADPAREVMDRQLLLSHLLEIVSQFREIQDAESLASVNSFSKVYDEGDLGFIPKSIVKKRTSKSSKASQSLEHSESSKVDIRKSGTSVSLSSPSVSSIQTIPSVHVLPQIETSQELEMKPSIESFVTSTKSTLSEEQSEEDLMEGKTDIEKQLLASKLEIQKSIMKDLAYSQSLNYKASQLVLPDRPSLSSIPVKKSVTIITEEESSPALQNVQEEREPEEQNVIVEEKKGDEIDESKVTPQEISGHVESESSPLSEEEKHKLEDTS